jgi:hypothetical protein
MSAGQCSRVRCSAQFVGVREFVGDFPSFPVDDATLLAVEHAMGYYLTFEAEDGSRLDEPRGAGADYSLYELMDFLAGCVGEGEPGDVELVSGDPDAPDGPGPFGIGPDTPIYIDHRIHYTERDIIKALIVEVRRLRKEQESLRLEDSPDVNWENESN